MKHTSRLLASRRGAAAVEFAIIAPIFVLTLLTLCAYAIYLSTAHAVQQMAADSARLALAGLDEAERIELARGYIERATLDYVFIERSALSVAVEDDVEPSQFTVRLTYDASNLPIWGLFTFPLPSSDIERFATIRVGGI